MKKLYIILILSLISLTSFGSLLKISYAETSSLGGGNVGDINTDGAFKPETLKINNNSGLQGGLGSNSSLGGGNCDSSKTLCNPLKVDTLGQLLTAILKIIVEIGTVVSVFMIIYSGFLFVKAQGNPAEISKAKSAFYTAVIGMVVLLGAQAIAMVITSTISQLQ